MGKDRLKLKTTYSDIGQFNERIELQNYTTTSTDLGGTEAEWSTEDTIWSRVEPVNGSEKWEIESLKGNISHVVTIRYNSNLTIGNESRFIYDGRTLYIKYALNKGEDNAYMKLACTEEGYD